MDQRIYYGSSLEFMGVERPGLSHHPVHNSVLLSDDMARRCRLLAHEANQHTRADPAECTAPGVLLLWFFPLASK